jgi:geranylgeranyl diphosphate synthase type I
MRIELAVGQFADLASDVGDLPPIEAVLDVARQKSGNYTVRRPLEIGAAMAVSLATVMGPLVSHQLGTTCSAQRAWCPAPRGGVK